MPTYEKRGGRWRVRIMRGRVRETKTFHTKAEGVAWASMIDALGATTAPRDATVRDLLDLYAERVSPKKRGERWEVIRLQKIGRDKLGAVKLSAAGKADVSAWRDRREKEVAAGSVRREWNLLASVFTWAVREIGWLESSPMAGVKRPVDPPPRTRRITDAELTRIYHACDYSPDSPPLTLQARVGAAVRLAIASAMRAGELTALRWDDVQGAVALVRKGKTGSREVPLAPDALAVLDQLREVTTKDGRVLAMDGTQLDALWRKARDRALLVDVHFHDTRAEALTRLARKVDVLTLARISGHRDLRILSRVYYRESAEDIAARLK